jgi:hypothetical protein
MIAMAAMIARAMPPHFNVGTSQVGMVPSFAFVAANLSLRTS